MAEGILIVRTTPGRRRPGPETLAIGAVEAVFFYRILPPVVDNGGAKMAPSSLADLVAAIGQPMIDRYVSEIETDGLESGDGGFEFVSESREVIREPDGSFRLETQAEMVARFKDEFPIRKAAKLAEWTATYKYTGKRFAP